MVVDDYPEYKTHMEIIREEFFKRIQDDSQAIWDREHEYIMSRKFEIMDFGKDEFKAGDWIMFKSIVKNWFTDGSDMEMSIPGVIVEVSNDMAKCEFLSFGEKIEQIVALDRLSHRYPRQNENDLCVTNKKPCIMNGKEEGKSSELKADPTLISVRDLSSSVLSDVRSVVEHSQVTLDLLTGMPPPPENSSNAGEAVIHAPVEYIASNLDGVHNMVNQIHSNLSHIDRIIGKGNDN